MAGENKEKDLKIPSNCESADSFEEKMARIQAILSGQKSEIAARRDGLAEAEKATAAQAVPVVPAIPAINEAQPESSGQTEKVQLERIFESELTSQDLQSEASILSETEQTSSAPLFTDVALPKATTSSLSLAEPIFSNPAFSNSALSDTSLATPAFPTLSESVLPEVSGFEPTTAEAKAAAGSTHTVHFEVNMNDNVGSALAEAQKTGASIAPVVAKSTNLSDSQLKSQTEQAREAASHKKSAIKKAHRPLILGLIAIMLLAAAALYYFVQNSGKNHSSLQTQNSASSQSSSSAVSSAALSASDEASSEASSSQPSSAISSSSVSTSSSSAASPVPQTRAEVIASVQPSPAGKPYLDPNITGQEAAFTWPTGLQVQFISNAQASGKISGSDYKLIPAQIAGGQGWVNLYNGSGQFVASINLTTGYVLQ